jgi:signal transduction histidine kinase
MVKDGIIIAANQLAKNRQIHLQTSILELLNESTDAYREFEGGILYLTLQLGRIRCGATVTRQSDADLFILDRDSDQCQLQTLALAGQQLRVPLANVMNLADSLLPELEGEQKEKAVQMRKALFQLMRPISNMADADRYAGQRTTTYEYTELRNFFREIVEKSCQHLEKTNVTVHFTCPDRPVFTLINREQMERATYNLLSNAVTFSRPGSSVKVTLSRTKTMACLTVEDEGDGIAAHVQGTLFHRYLREPAIEDSRFGLGLGMTLVRSVASLHKGTVLLEQDKGTRVTMTMLIRKKLPAEVHSPAIRISDYAGGLDLALLEFSDLLPVDSYDE